MLGTGNSQFGQGIAVETKSYNANSFDYNNNYFT